MTRPTEQAADRLQVAGVAGGMPRPKALPVIRLDQRTYDRALACVHCGLCLPTCPTYVMTGHEADSPRGRIQLIKGLADGTVGYDSTTRAHLELCLDCRACETACPSEVVYHELIEEARLRLAEVEASAREPDPSAVAPLSKERPAQRGGVASWLLRWFLLSVLTDARRLRWALLPARLLQRARLFGLIGKCGLLRLLPGGQGGAFAKLVSMLPEGEVWPKTPAARTAPASGDARLRVVYFGTCVGSVLFAEVNRKAVALLSAMGAEVVYPPHGRGAGRQGCCGAIAHHNADEAAALNVARQNIDTLLALKPDRIACAVAGCGAQLREYAHLLRDDPAYGERARALVSNVRDVTELLLELGWPGDHALRSLSAVATYHDACHLAHGQRVTTPPRRLLERVPGLSLRALRESDLCCGAAGTYNLLQPDMARRLGERKIEHVRRTGADWLISGNAGCTLHLALLLRAAGEGVVVRHPVEVLYDAMFGFGEEGTGSGVKRSPFG